GTNSDPVLHLDRAMEIGPPVRPVVRHRGGRDVDQRAAGGRLELSELRHLAGRTVDRELDPARPTFLLHAGGRELEQVREDVLGVFRSAANREPDHAQCPARGAAPRNDKDWAPPGKDAGSPNGSAIRVTEDAGWRRSGAVIFGVRFPGRALLSAPRPGGLLPVKRLVEPLGRLALLVGELARDRELEDDVLVASGPAAERRQSLPLEHRDVAVLGPGRDLDRLLPLEGVHADLAADDGSAHRDASGADQLRPLPGEPLVGGDSDLDVEVALARPSGAGVPGAGDPDALPVVDAGGNVDLPGAGVGRAP